MGQFRLRFVMALGFLLGATGAAFAQDSYSTAGKETLWAVASKVNAGRTSTIGQMAWALYRANPQAFDGSPDKLRPNATLKVPTAAFVAEVPADQAYAYVTGRAAPPAPRAAPVAPVAPPVVAFAPVAP